MNLFRNRLIIGFLFRLVTGTINLIYKIITLLNLHLALLVIMLGFITFVIIGVEPSGTLFTIFTVALFISVLYAVFGTVKNLLGLNNKPKKKRGAQLVKAQPQQRVVEQPQLVEQEYQSYVATSRQTVERENYIERVVERPTYFRTKQNPDYIFAEYSDRYELFKINAGQLVKIRTDYKNI